MYDVPMNKDLLKKPRISNWIAGPAIAIAWVLFFPAGIYLTYIRASIDKKAAMTISIFLIILGVIYFIGGLRFLSGGLVGDDLVNMNALIIMGLILNFIGIYTRKSAKRFLKYIVLVIDQEYRSIEDIADAMSTTYDVAKKHLTRLIKDGYFRGCYIDEAIGEIVFPMDNSKPINVKVNVLPAEGETRLVECKSCGAHNKVIGKVGQCEYCRSSINA